MANLSYQQSKTTGVAAAFTAAAAGGDNVPVSDRGVVLIRNSGVATRNVTVAVPGTAYLQNRPDIPVAVAAGTTAAIGPFPQDLADPVDFLVHLTYDNNADLTIAVLSI